MEGANSPAKRLREAGDAALAFAQRKGEEEEEENCPICLSAWTSHGDHQVCSLRCGHFFGYSCITKALNQQTKKLRSCPLCHQKADHPDVRKHYTSSIRTKDNTREHELRQQLELEKACRAQAELDVAKANTCVLNLEQELKAMRDIVRTKKCGSSSDSRNLSGDHQLCGTSGPRLTRTPLNMNMSRLACWISTELGFAVAVFEQRKYRIVLVHPDSPEYVTPIETSGHDLPIKDIALLLSDTAESRMIAVGSLDGTVSLISIPELKEYHRLEVGEPVLSVIFGQPNRLFVGTTKGNVYALDTRHSNQNTKCLMASHREPVHTLFRVKPAGEALSLNLFIAITFTQIFAFSADKEVNSLLMNLPNRQPGEQYISGMALRDGCLFAVSVRSPTCPTVYLAEVSISGMSKEASFVLKQQFTSLHTKPLGRIAWVGGPIVADESTNMCVRYGSHKRYGDGILPITGVFASDDGAWIGMIAPNVFMIQEA